MSKIAVFHRPSGPPGGDTQVARHFTDALNALGVSAIDLPAGAPIPEGIEYAHVWAACSPDWGLPLAVRLGIRNIPFTISPEWYPRDARQAFYGRVGDIASGYTPSVAMMMQLSTGLACATMGELRECWKLAPRHPGFVMGAAFAPPEINYQIETQDSLYALCVARIEEHKNQLTALMACNWLGLPFYCIGSEANQEYANHLKAGGARLFGRIDNHADVMGWMRNALVHVLPSFGEIVAIANQEAAYCGTPMVIGSTCHDWEYFGDRASYCDPTDWRDIAHAINEAIDNQPKPWVDQPTWKSVAKRWIEWTTR